MLGVLLEVFSHLFFVKLNASEVYMESNTLILQVRVIKSSLANHHGVGLVSAHGEEGHLQLECDLVSVVNNDLAKRRVGICVTSEFVEHFNLIINADSSVFTQFLDVTG